MELLLVKLKHEVFRKPCEVSLYGLNERTRFDLIETGKAATEHHSIAAQEKDLLFDQFGEWSRRHRR